MSSKSKKNLSLWYKCEKCQASISQRDTEVHVENCPPSTNKLIHPYILDNFLYGSIDIKTSEDIKGLSFHEKNNLVFLSQSAIQLCSFIIGDWALLTFPNLHLPPCAKIIWPTTEKSVNSILVTQSAYDLLWKGFVNIKVSVSKFDFSTARQAEKIILIALNAPKNLQLNQELSFRIKKLHLNRYVTMHNRLSVKFYGKDLEFQIKEIVSSENNTEDNSIKHARNLAEDFKQLNVNEDKYKFNKIVETTTFKLFTEKKTDDSVPQNIDPLSVIGGVDKEISEIQDLIDVALGKVRKIKGMKISRGILLYGSSGTGKTMIANAVAQSSNSHVIAINGPDTYSKYVGETESAITNLFKEALDQSPSIILLDEIDILCPIRSSRVTDQEKRVVSIILNQFDSIHTLENCKVCVLATSSRPDSIDPALRRCGRLDREIEIPIPNPISRFQILKKLLSESKVDINEQDLKEVTNAAHGFVGSDLVSLCSRATMCSIKRNFTGEIKIKKDDFKFALTRVRPSAMREVQIEIPDVKWSDIGGQQYLKLILKQAVEWPLKYADSFKRMGITPPKGVLMFGPPGCSKTMIAKALATESGLNFLSIKGPELFSKWVGESERAVRDVFRRARQVAPSVIFFDEIDALGGERSGGTSGGSTSVQERVLAQLLTELDGVTPLGDVTVLAATNRPDRIDKALLRPGRLDRIIYVPLPDAGTRREIFNLKLKRMPVTNVNVDDLVNMTVDYSGAEIQAVCHEAAMKALEEDINAVNITWTHFEKALEIITPRTPPSLLKIYEDYLNK